MTPVPNTLCPNKVLANVKIYTPVIFTYQPVLGTLSWKKNGKKRGHCPLLATPPPKRVKRGHLLSDYRQKCVNGTRDSYCGVKRLILTHIDSYCGVKSPFFLPFFFKGELPLALGPKKGPFLVQNGPQKDLKDPKYGPESDKTGSKWSAWMCFFDIRPSSTSWELPGTCKAIQFQKRAIWERCDMPWR